MCTRTRESTQNIKVVNWFRSNISIKKEFLTIRLMCSRTDEVIQSCQVRDYELRASGISDHIKRRRRNEECCLLDCPHPVVDLVSEYFHLGDCLYSTFLKDRGANSLPSSASKLLPRQICSGEESF